MYTNITEPLLDAQLQKIPVKSHTTLYLGQMFTKNAYKVPYADVANDEQCDSIRHDLIPRKAKRSKGKLPREMPVFINKSQP